MSYSLVHLPLVLTILGVLFPRSPALLPQLPRPLSIEVWVGGCGRSSRMCAQGEAQETSAGGVEGGKGNWMYIIQIVCERLCATPDLVSICRPYLKVINTNADHRIS